MADTDPRRLARIRLWLWLLVALAALGLGILLALRFVTQGPPQVIAGAPADVGQHFSLVDRDGKPVTAQTLKGTPYAIFFGFTRCPDICPTTLSRMAHLRKAMGADGDKFRIVFVSVDSGHDKPADVGAYVDLFGTPILGLTGSPTQIADAAKSFRVFYQKIPLEGGDYTIDHSAFVILMDRDGRLQSLLSDQDSEDAALAELRRLIA
ncbi:MULTISPECIES: SCO family protein [unclassified Sphingobium]|uniref:SCO family protein n=1 Tax=unclassified Sphingobium TaxID=2611147 RepID=UPI002224F5EF|nr:MULTISPECIES: SCO family protein [unclassified Sphingobium]MCW2382476.1 protein SCO1/2 [Sphingobium sp. B2D3B]MCW2397351.1 protein SCO1/2 [Sphingobium sp. B2D3C]